MITEELSPAKEIDSAVTRSCIYKLLSLGFRYPTSELFRIVRSGELMTELLQEISSVPHLQRVAYENQEAIGKLQDKLDGLSFEDFEVRYVNTFDVGFPEPPCPAYEGLYRDEERTAIMIEVAEFYNHFGLRMSRDENKRELPDYICAELEFLHFLAFKEALAREQGETELMEGYILAQKDFLHRHLVAWIPKFSTKLKEAAEFDETVTTVFYPELANLTASVVGKDLEWMNSQA